MTTFEMRESRPVMKSSGGQKTTLGNSLSLSGDYQESNGLGECEVENQL